MKEPHNYRKVGYSMIVISVSLVVIGLIVWAIGANYHFASDLMSGQEIDAMTPKIGYNIVSFDDAQPVGAKLKLLDHAGTNETAFQLKKQYVNSAGTILVFDSSVDDNRKLIEDTKNVNAQIAQEKTTAVANSNQPAQSVPSSTSINMSPVVNANVTTNNGNESVVISEQLNTTSSISSPQTGQETLTEKVNATTNTNQTTTNGAEKSVNLSENVGIIAK